MSTSKVELSEAAKASLRGSAAEFAKIGTLVPWSENPRRNEAAVDEVARSIARFGFGAPLVARSEDRMIIAGHTRFAAAKRLGLPEVPVRFLDISENEAKALALADNSLGELAMWADNLGEVLSDLADDGVGLDGLGWDSGDLERLIDGIPDFIGADRINDDGTRTNNNMSKMSSAGSGARIFRFGDLRCIVNAEVYDATVIRCEGFSSSYEGIVDLFCKGLEIDVPPPIFEESK